MLGGKGGGGGGDFQSTAPMDPSAAAAQGGAKAAHRSYKDKKVREALMQKSGEAEEFMRKLVMGEIILENMF